MVFPFLLAIIPAITSAITAITTAVATVGPAIAAYAAKIGPAIIKMAHTAGPVLTRVVEVANVVAPALQVFNKGETVESIGERSLQAAEEGIIPEQFEDFDEYMEKIRNFPLDNNKAEHRKTTIPEASIVAGLGISTLGL
ncbi:MAG: hypothetical protein GX029_02600, partial [Pseudomonadaceae bacterium]|nr:hypothetical protein [Pseudomonadaceae bacterium]